MKTVSQNYTDLAVAERPLGLLQDENAASRTRMEALEQGFVRVQRGCSELEGQHDMLSGNFDELHYGLVMLCGFTNHTSLTPARTCTRLSVQIFWLQGPWALTAIWPQCCNRTVELDLVKTPIWVTADLLLLPHLQVSMLK